MQQFVRNNIRYRSASAKALEGYYNSKAFILNEIISSKHRFSETAKEILLLLFNTHNSSLFHVESLLLDKSVVSKEDVSEIGSELTTAFQGVCTIFDRNIDIFDSNFIRHWMRVHKQPRFTLNHMIGRTVNMSPILAFPYITEALISYLSATMFELSELDCLLGSNIVKRRVTQNDSFPDGLILYMDDVTQTYEEQTGVCAETERLLYYVETLIDSKSFPIEVRDYFTRSEEINGGAKASGNLLKQLKSYGYVSDVTLVKKVVS